MVAGSSAPATRGQVESDPTSRPQATNDPTRAWHALLAKHPLASLAILERQRYSAAKRCRWFSKETTFAKKEQEDAREQHHRGRWSRSAAAALPAAGFVAFFSTLVRHGL